MWCGFYNVLGVEKVFCCPANEGEAVFIIRSNIFTNLFKGEEVSISA